jgi:hypothetical protein
MKRCIAGLAAAIALAVSAAPAQATHAYRAATVSSTYAAYLPFADARDAVRRAWGYTITSIPCDRVSNTQIKCWSSDYDYYFEEWGGYDHSWIDIWRFHR